MFIRKMYFIAFTRAYPKSKEVIKIIRLHHEHDESHRNYELSSEILKTTTVQNTAYTAVNVENRSKSRGRGIAVCPYIYIYIISPKRITYTVMHPKRV